jgi:hypothetical protein
VDGLERLEVHPGSLQARRLKPAAVRADPARVTDHWLPPAQHRTAGVATQPAPAQQPLAVVPGFPPPPPPAPARSGLAIAALVVAVVALLGVIGLALVVAGSGLPWGGFPGDGGSGYELEGTLPQAEQGRVYSAEEVRAEVERVLEADWSTFEDLTCGPLTFEPGASTSCSGVVDDLPTDLEVDVDDAAGHFTLTQYW